MMPAQQKWMMPSRVTEKRQRKAVMENHVPRFWSKVEKTDGCWIWRGATSGRGYGAFYLARGNKILAHRAAYQMVIGPVPDGADLDHLCRNKMCVNPAHLEAVSHAENVRRGAVPNREFCRRGLHRITADNIYPGTKGSCYQCRRDWVAANREHLRAWERDWRQRRKTA
jgi:hypothetical protein